MLTDTSEFKSNGARLPNDRPEPEYLHWGPEDSPIGIHINLDAVDGIARDVLEGLDSTPRRDGEVGGLLLGRVVPGGSAVWVEQFQRIPCEHIYGPHFILTDRDTAALEDAATKIFEARDVAVVGLYRSHTRPGLQLEESDFDLMRRYFSDPSDLILLVKPGKGNNLFGQFYRYEPGGGGRPVGERFPFRGRVVTPDTQLVTPDTARTAPTETPLDQTPDDRERTRAHRLLADYQAVPVEQAPSVFGLSDPAVAEHWRRPVESDEPHRPSAIRKWLPLVLALLLVSGLVWLVIGQGRFGPLSTASSTTSPETSRPLGLYVNPQGDTWRVLWNTNATSLRDARNVQLFAREGDDQQRVELSAKDLAAGTFEYHPVSNDVMFRLEVTDKAGHVSAESFRLMKTDEAASGKTPSASKTPATTGAAPVPPPQTSRIAPAPPAVNEPARTVPAKPVYRAPPVVAAGIRPRIKGSVPIDVRVRIDERGRVISATPITKLHDAIDEYLGGRAVLAARQWRFEPARENGKAVQGTQTIHFVFTK
jgi:hypothetical protein